MRIPKRIYYYGGGLILIIILVITSVRYLHTWNYDRLKTIKSHFSAIPTDSVYARLQKISPYITTQKDRALYNSLMAECLLDKDELQDADSLSRLALRYYSFNTNDSAQIGYLYMLRGEIMHEQHRQLGASDAIMEASKYFKYLKDDAEFGYWLNYYLSTEYQMQGANEKADSCLKKLLSYAYALADTTLIYESSDCLSKFYLKNEQYENAFKLQSALYAQILPEDTLKRIACLENLAYIHLRRKSVAVALEQLDEARQLQTTPSDKWNLLRGETFLESGRRDSAQYYFEQVLRGKETDYQNKARAYHGLYRMKRAAGDARQALSYLEGYISQMDSMREQRRDSRASHLQTLREYSKEEQEMEDAEYRLVLHQNLIFRGVLIVAGLLLILICLTIYFHRKRLKTKLLYESAQLKSSILQQQKMEAENRLLQEQTTLKQKDLELSELKLNYFRKLNLLTLPLIYNNKSNVHIRMGGQEWQHIYDNTNACFTDFTQRLQEAFPGLKEEDIRFCCLVKMELPLELIALIFNIEKGSVSQRKQRLRSKMDISGTFDEFIQAF